MSFQKWEADKPVQPTHGPAPAVKEEVKEAPKEKAPKEKAPKKTK
jgi:hypothetical protein